MLEINKIPELYKNHIFCVKLTNMLTVEAAAPRTAVSSTTRPHGRRRLVLVARAVEKSSRRDHSHNSSVRKRGRQ